MLKKAFFGAQFALVLLSGCAATFTENRGNDEGVQLAAMKIVYIISPEDGRYGGKIMRTPGE